MIFKLIKVLSRAFFQNSINFFWDYIAYRTENISGSAPLKEGNEYDKFASRKKATTSD